MASKSGHSGIEKRARASTSPDYAVQQPWWQARQEAEAKIPAQLETILLGCFLAKLFTARHGRMLTLRKRCCSYCMCAGDAACPNLSAEFAMSGISLSGERMGGNPLRQTQAWIKQVPFHADGHSIRQYDNISRIRAQLQILKPCTTTTNPVGTESADPELTPCILELDPIAIAKCICSSGQPCLQLAFGQGITCCCYQ